MLRHKDESRSSVPYASAPRLCGQLVVEPGHERWGRNNFMATLYDRAPGDRRVLADLFQVRIGPVDYRAMVLHGVEEEFQRRGKTRFVHWQAWAVELLDLPLRLVRMRERGEPRGKEVCAADAGLPGTLIVDHHLRGRPDMRAVFCDGDKVEEIARLHKVRLVRMAEQGIVLVGAEDLRGARDRVPRWFKQAWWLKPRALELEHQNVWMNETDDEEEPLQALTS